MSRAHVLVLSHHVLSGSWAPPGTAERAGFLAIGL